MNRVPLEIASKIVSSNTLSRKDVLNLARTISAALPLLWNLLDICLKSEDWGMQVGLTLYEGRSERFLNGLPHLHALVERVEVVPAGTLIKLHQGGAAFETCLIGPFRVLADRFPSLPSLVEFQCETGQVHLLPGYPEAAAAAVSLLISLFRSEVTTITVFGSLLSLVTKFPAADATLQSRVERVCFGNHGCGHDAIEQMAALSFAPKLTSLDIRCAIWGWSRRIVGPDEPLPIVADGFWSRLRHLTITSRRCDVFKFVLDSAQSFTTKRYDGSGLVLHELVLEQIPLGFLVASITSLATPSLSLLNIVTDYDHLDEDAIGLIATNFPYLTELSLTKPPDNPNSQEHSVVSSSGASPSHPIHQNGLLLTTIGLIKQARLAQAFSQFRHLEMLKFEEVLRRPPTSDEVVNWANWIEHPRETVIVALSRWIDESEQVEFARSCRSLRRIGNDELGWWNVMRDGSGEVIELRLKLAVDPEETVLWDIMSD